MIEELWKNSAIIAKRNVDSNQTPISVKLIELKQIIDAHSCVVLNQIPDESYGINIEGYTEVYDIEDVTTKAFKVDYANGVIYFHPYNVGKNIVVDYSGMGCTLLSASRIYTKYDKYGNVLETLEELIDKAKLYLQAIESLGGAVEVINRVENANATGTRLHENLSNDIEVGTPLQSALRTDINEAKTFKDQLKKDVADGKVLSPELRSNIIEGENTNAKLIQTRANAQNDISKINATGNKSLVIGASQFTNNAYTWLHNMNNDNLIVNFIDSTTNEPLLPDYKIIDKNNILLRNSTEHPNLKVILSASYYQGNSLFGTNVEEFSGENIGTNGKIVRLKDDNGVIQNPITNSDAVFMPDGATRLTDELKYQPRATELLNEVMRKLRYGEKINIVCMGDSLTYGYDITSEDRRPADSVPTPNGSIHIRERASITYPEALEKYLNIVYPSKVSVINRGFSGDTTTTSFPKWNSNPNSNITMIMFGTNDSSNNVSIENFLGWYRKIIKREIGWGSAVILLTPPRRRETDIKGDTYGNAVYQLGKEFGCPVVDMTEMTANISADNFSDATHLNGKGYNYLGARLASLFIGEGIVNPIKVNSGRVLSAREYVDGIKYISNTGYVANVGYPTPDESELGAGVACSINENGKVIYSFYTESDDLLIYPSLFFSNENPIKFSLDFGTESQAVSNSYIYDQSRGDYEKHVTTVINYLKTDCNWRTQTDVFYINGVQSLDEKKIHVPKRGWHTLLIEGNNIRLHGLDFVNFREMRSMVELNKIKFPKWENVIYENGWETASGVPLKYRKEGTLVILTGWITKANLDTTIIATLEEGFRPVITQKHKITVGGTSAIQSNEPTLNISTDGKISLVHAGNTTNNILAINLVFPVA